MFDSNGGFNGDISQWNVSNVTNMNSMFKNALSFSHIGDWDVSSVNNMSYMFIYNTVFDRDLSAWNVSNVFSFDGMFNLTELSETNDSHIMLQIAILDTSWSSNSNIVIMV